MDTKEPLATETKKQMRTSISKTEGSKRTDISVEAIDNGYLVTTCIEDTKDGKWDSKTTKYFSKENPLMEEEKEENDTKELAKGMSGLLDSLAGYEGKINI